MGPKKVSAAKKPGKHVAVEMSSGEPAQEIPSSLIREMCGVWEKLQDFAEKRHPDKTVAFGAVNLFNDDVMSHFRSVLKKREKQASMDRFLTSPGSSEQQPGLSCTIPAKCPREATAVEVPEVLMEGDSPSHQ